MAQTATIHEEMMEMKTYPFSDPNPIPDINRIYRNEIMKGGTLSFTMGAEPNKTWGTEIPPPSMSTEEMVINFK